MKKWNFGQDETTQIWIPPEVAETLGKKEYVDWGICISKTKTTYKRMDFVNGTLVRTKKGRIKNG